MINKKLIIIPLLVTLFIMATGYSLLSRELKLDGTAKTTGEWNIKITNIEILEVTKGSDAGIPTFTDTSANFEAKLKKPGDIIKYKVTIKNDGTINAKLNSINFKVDVNSSPAIIYENTNPADILKANDTTTFIVTVKYDENQTEIPELKTKNITGTINYVQQ